MRIIKLRVIILFIGIFCSLSTTSVKAGSMPWLFLLLGDNTAPVANAGADQTIKTGTVVTLDGSNSSDADKDTLSYQWTLTRPEGSSAILSSSTNSSTQFTPDIDGSYTLTLIVNDGKVNSTPDTVVVTALSNFPPIANAGADQTVSTGAVVNLTGSGSSDADGDPLTYTWAITGRPVESSASLLFSETQGWARFTADKAGIYTLTLIVNDGKVDSEPDTVVITSQTGQ